MLAFEVLPELQKEIKSQRLAEVVTAHLEQTREHVARVEQAFRVLEAEPSSSRNEALAGLAGQHDDVAANVVEPHLKDLFHADAAIHTEHLELAGYEAAITLARTIGANEAASLLEQNRDDEEQALKLLHGEAERLARAVNDVR
jgi:ferritin-like metal-binding protein YciE